MSGGQSLRYEALVPWLRGCGLNVYTQFGEDGLIASVFKKIGETNRQCFEIGAADGLFFSNTLRLRELGWESLQMEADPTLFEKLQSNYGEQCWCLFGRFTDLHPPLKYAGVEDCPDLGVIDIDGQDFYLWEDLTLYRPRVMLVEISTRHPEEPAPLRGGEGQAGLSAIKSLGESKCYQLVATTHCNALFVDAKEL